MVELSYMQHPGGISEEDFNALLPAARAAVEFVVGINEVTDEGRYRRAVWAAMGALADTYDGPGLTVGSFTLHQGGSKSRAEAARDAAYEVLATSGMAYGGIA